MYGSLGLSVDGDKQLRVTLHFIQEAMRLSPLSRHEAGTARGTSLRVLLYKGREYSSCARGEGGGTVKILSTEGKKIYDQASPNFNKGRGKRVPRPVLARVVYGKMTGVSPEGSGGKV